MESKDKNFSKLERDKLAIRKAEDRFWTNEGESSVTKNGSNEDVPRWIVSFSRLGLTY